MINIGRDQVTRPGLAFSAFEVSIMFPPIATFTSLAANPYEMGTDALLYVMEHGHAVSVPLPALYFAEKLAIRSIASRDVDPIVLSRVNAAIDTIAAAIRVREALERDEQAARAIPIEHVDRPNEGPMARLSPRPIVRPPAPEKVDIPF